MSVCRVQSTPAGLRAPDQYGAAAWPLVSEQQRLPRKVFRRSIAWLSDSLSTLRRAGCPATTQDSLPAAGQALPDGLLPAGFLRKVSECFLTSHPPSPSFAWRNHINRGIVHTCGAAKHSHRGLMDATRKAAAGPDQAPASVAKRRRAKGGWPPSSPSAASFSPAA